MTPERRIRLVQRLGVICLVLTLLVMGMGSWTKATGSGLSCPDWPQCYGEWFPPFPSVENGGTWTHEANGTQVTEKVYYTQAQELYEWTHRALVSVLGVPILLFAILAVFGTQLSKGLRVTAGGTVLMLGIQGALGAATVLTGNPAAITTLHLVTATLFLLVLTIATCIAYLRPLAPVPPAPPEEEQPKPARFQGFVYSELDTTER